MIVSWRYMFVVSALGNIIGVARACAYWLHTIGVRYIPVACLSSMRNRSYGKSPQSALLELKSPAKCRRDASLIASSN